MTKAPANTNAVSAVAGAPCSLERKRPLLLAVALIAETCWMAALVAMAWHNISF